MVRAAPGGRPDVRHRDGPPSPGRRPQHHGAAPAGDNGAGLPGAVHRHPADPRPAYRVGGQGRGKAPAGHLYGWQIDPLTGGECLISHYCDWACITDELGKVQLARRASRPPGELGREPSIASPRGPAVVRRALGPVTATSAGGENDQLPARRTGKIDRARALLHWHRLARPRADRPLRYV
jgi:hypothetical protein